MSRYTFEGTMPVSVLREYLSKAATAQWIDRSDTLEDDIRVIKKLGLKFLGRASGIWKAETDDETHFAQAKQCADRIHEADPEIILQACIFEYIYKEDLSRIPVPAFVFTAFGLPVEDRCFDFDRAVIGGNGTQGIPDLSKTEAQMWFYYRAVRYIDAGYEAFHMGQIHLYTSFDRGFAGIGKVLSMMRDYAKTHARRKKILIDAHSHGCVVNGKSLLDYNAMPYTRFPVLDRPGEKLVLVREGSTAGGITPDGESVRCLPFLLEYDNWGGKDVYAHEHLTYEERAWAQWWGYDQIAWFASQEEQERNRFLDYTFKWTAVNNPDAYFAFPLRRPLHSGEVVGGYPFYKMNNRGENCPDGFSQEDEAYRLLQTGYEKYRAFANPTDILDYGCRRVCDEETGVMYPEKAVVYGSFQPYVGAVANDSNSEITRMYYIGDGTYALTFLMPYQGTYDFAISAWGTLSACASPCMGKMLFSGTGGKSELKIENDNTVVRITYHYMENSIEVTQLS